MKNVQKPKKFHLGKLFEEIKKKNQKVAVKVISQFGEESMKVIKF